MGGLNILTDYLLVSIKTRIINSIRERCLIGYSRQDLLQEHIVECKGINERAIRIEMPTKRNKFVKFENHKNQLKPPWVIYTDFEANSTKIEGPTQNTNKFLAFHFEVTS